MTLDKMIAAVSEILAEHELSDLSFSVEAKFWHHIHYDGGHKNELAFIVFVCNANRVGGKPLPDHIRIEDRYPGHVLVKLRLALSHHPGAPEPTDADLAAVGDWPESAAAEKGMVR